MGRLAPMIIPALLVAVLCCPGCGGAGLAPYHELESAKRIPTEKRPESHGPIDDFPSDPYSAYPGLGFGPMGPVARSVLPNDATDRKSVV